MRKKTLQVRSHSRLVACGMQGVGLAANFGIYPRRFGFAGPGISVRSAIMRSRERKRVMYKIEIMPGVTFTHNFSTVCEARIFMRELNAAMNDLGLIPFKYEIVKVTEEQASGTVIHNGEVK